MMKISEQRESSIEDQLRRSEVFSQIIQYTELDDLLYSIIDSCIGRLGKCSDPMEVMRLSGMIQFGEMFLGAMRNQVNLGKELRARREKEAQRLNQQLKDAANRNKRFVKDAAI